MKKNLVVFILLCGITTSFLMYAKQGAHDVTYRPCFFDYSQFVATSSAGMEMHAELMKMEEKFHKEAMQKEAELKKMVDEYKSKAPLLSQSARVSEENKLKEAEEQYRNMVRRMQQELTACAEEYGKEISGLLQSKLETFANNNGYTVIFDIATGRIVYCEEQLNMTSAIVAMVNEETEKMKQQDMAQEVAHKEKTKAA